jgi:hypothetical protein
MDDARVSMESRRMEEIFMDMMRGARLCRLFSNQENAMSRTASHKRRQLHFQSLVEVVSDAENLASGPCRTLGHWTLGQILWHLSRPVYCSFEGFGFQAPWFVRKIIAPLIKHRFLHKPMRAGFKLPRSANSLLPPEEISTEEGLRQLKAAFARFENETPGAPHPAFGYLSPDEWRLLHLRHSELHLSFVRPA